jgi:sugar/nucleoside kinase (ribokinase family)
LSDILIVGSVALDSVETPFGKVENALGGSASYGASAASLFAPVNLVGVVGSDFPKAHLDYLGSRADTRGLQIIQDGFTFRWSGRYDYDLDTTETLDTQLNVFADFHPVLSDGYEKSPFVFLANIHPSLQYEVLQQCRSTQLTMMDTFELWIKTAKQELIQTMKHVDVVSINEAEARMFAGTSSLPSAARAILGLGPKILLIKKGDAGAVMFTNDSYFVAPAYPLEEVKDPTGAGDSFAGGFMGHLARSGEITPATIRKAIIYGSAVASFTVSEFSVGALRNLTLDQVQRRYEEFIDITHFDLART